MNLRGRNKVSAEFSMSSMTDIVFLLLVFFMLTSNAPNALDLLLPKSKGKTTTQQSVAVSITKDLVYYVDSKQTTEEELENVLAGVLQDDEEASIMLRAEQGVPIEKAAAVMDIAYRNRYKIVLAVKP